MDVAELLAQKYQLRAERNEAPAEPEITLTKSELDHILRREFAARERAMQEMIDRRIEVALAKHTDAIAATLAERKMLADARQEAVGRAMGQLRKQIREEIVVAVGELRADLYIEKTHAGDSAKVIVLPNPLRDRSRAG